MGLFDTGWRAVAAGQELAAGEVVRVTVQFAAVLGFAPGAAEIENAVWNNVEIASPQVSVYSLGAGQATIQGALLTGMTAAELHAETINAFADLNNNRAVPVTAVMVTEVARWSQAAADSSPLFSWSTSIGLAAVAILVVVMIAAWKTR
jgi:hypothetical protein